MSQEFKDIILNQINLLRKEVTCSICLDLFIEPITLIICQHTFCLECYKGLFSNKTSPKSVECPICKRLSKRRSYYLNEQFGITGLINMYDKFVNSTDEQKLVANENYDLVKMEQFLDDCMAYKGKGDPECVSLSSSADDTDTVVRSKLINTELKTNLSFESKCKTSKTPNRKVKALNTSKIKRKSPKKQQKKTSESANNSELIKIDVFDSPDICQLQEDENKIVKLIEDDIVKNIENEYLNLTKNYTKIELQDNKDNKKQLEKPESNLNWNTKSVESNSSKKTTSTGWSRMKTMKKQIKKKEVKYKQFNVSINKSKSKSPEDKTFKIEPVVLSRIDNEKNQDVTEIKTNLRITSNNIKVNNPINKVDKLLQHIDEDHNKDENEEDDEFSMCTQKLQTLPNIRYKENKNYKVDTSLNEINITKFSVEALVHHSSTPIKIVKEEVFVDRKTQNTKENICDIKKLSKVNNGKRNGKKKSSEETDNVISATLSTPDSTKQLGTRPRRSLRSSTKRNSEENNPLIEKKTSPKRKRENEKNTEVMIIDFTIEDQNIPEIHNDKNCTVVEKQSIKETTNKNKLSTEITEEQCVIDEKKNINQRDYLRNELKLFSEREPTVITSLQSSINAVKAVLSECSNYVNSDDLFPESLHSKESKNSSVETNDKPKILSDIFYSLPLQSNSRSSVDFYRTAIPCLHKVENYYDQIISLSQKITDETETFRNTYNNGKEFENILSFKSSKPLKNAEVQTDNISCPKCFYVIDFNSTDKIKPAEEVTRVNCFRELNDLDNISKEFSNENESQKSKNSNVSSKQTSSVSSNINILSNNSQMLAGSQFLHSKKVNRQLTFIDDSNNVGKSKFKRIRSPSPESDSESSRSKKSNFNFSKLYRSGIDIFFESDPNENHKMLSLSSKTDDSEIKKVVKKYKKILSNSQDSTSKYDSILEQEYKDAQFNEISKPALSTQKPNFDTAPNTVLDNLLGNVHSSVFENVNSELVKNNRIQNQLGTETEQRNIDNLLDNINLADFENDNFESPKNVENEQEINLTEKRDNIPDVLSASMFLHTEKEINKIIDTDKTKSFDIQPNVNTNLEIRNVEEKELDKEVENLTNQELVVEDSVGSDRDLFGEDNIVESTPQKTVENNKNRSNFDLEHLPVPLLDIIEPPPTETENLDWVDIVPLPPPEFQDTEKVVEPKLNNPNVSSITPDIFCLNPLDKGFFASSTFLSGNITNQTNKEQTQRNVEKESVYSENVISDSITHQMENQENKNNITSNSGTNVWTSAKRYLNPIALAQKEKCSPLQIIVNTNSSPKQVISSTPKQQKSILSYIQTSQKENANSTNKNVSRSSTAAKQNINNKSNTLQTEVCESKNNVPLPIENKINKLSNESTKNTSIGRSASNACIACSRLKRDEVLQTTSLAQKVKAKYSRDFNRNVTHLVVLVDDRNRVKDHTIKYVLAVAHSVWIVSFAWVKDSIENNRLLPEEPYEVLDLSGRPGPKISRLTRISDPLLKNFVICCANPLISVTKSEIENAIVNLGGETRNNQSDLIQQDGKICLIVTEAKETQDFDQYQDWRDTFNVLVVDMEWLSRTVGQYQITSVRPYILCLEKGINDLGYPPALIAPVPETPSQMTMTSTNH